MEIALVRVVVHRAFGVGGVERAGARCCVGLRVSKSVVPRGVSSLARVALTCQVGLLLQTGSPALFRPRCPVRVMSAAVQTPASIRDLAAMFLDVIWWR